MAEQVDALSAKTVRVVATGSIVEGFAALLAYDPAAGADDQRRPPWPSRPPASSPPR